MDRKTTINLDGAEDDMERDLHRRVEELKTIELDLVGYREALKLAKFRMERVTRFKEQQLDIVHNVARKCKQLDKKIMEILQDPIMKNGIIGYRSWVVIDSNNEDEKLKRLTRERENLQNYWEESREIADRYTEKLTRMEIWIKLIEERRKEEISSSLRQVSNSLRNFAINCSNDSRDE